MSQQGLLNRVVQALDDAGIAYMLTGSLVSSLQGEPRSTHDVDLVVALDRSSVRSLVDALRSPDLYLDEESIQDAISDQSMFNLIDVNEGDKVDFWILTDDAFDRSRFSRRRMEEAAGIRLSISAPEDTILMKLKWAKLSGGSEKHFTDALRVYEIQRESLDHAYLDSWAKTLAVNPLWDRLKDEAEMV